ncbi:MAG: hypothetical protein NC428_05650 [Clostridium sp.]|nr:hypothetical protein [Clostridium sp.]
MRYTVNEIKDRTVLIAKAYGIGKMSLFGSHVRGEAKLGKTTILKYCCGMK